MSAGGPRDSASSFAQSTPPCAERKPMRRSFHGRMIEDDYAWLAAKNWREALRDPSSLPGEIGKLLKAENAHCDQALVPAKALRKTLLAEMRGRIKEDDADPPAPDGPYSYYQRYRAGGEHPLICRRPRGGGDEEILLDAEALAKDHDFFEIGDAAHSRDHAALAWSVDDKGSELYAVRTRALSDGQDRADVVLETDGSIVWSLGGTSFYYVRVDDSHRTDAVQMHRIGARQREDRLVIEERDPAWFVSLSESRCGRFGVVTIHGHDASECHLIDLADENAPPRRVAPRESRLRYDVEPHGEQIFILANADGAEDFAIFSAPLGSSSRADWRVVVPHRKGRMLVAMTVYARHLVWIERENALPRLVIREIESGAEHAIAFEEEAYSLALEPGLEFDTTTLRFVYSSPTTPEETYDYDMTTRQRVLIKRQEIPSGHDPENYVARRISAKAPDGESVPITLLHRKGFEPGEGAPLLLYGYGAYGHSLDAEFDPDVLSLVDRGFVYALAHVRGGTERGWNWYENGKLDHKPNSFSDFIACARALIDAGFTRAGAIVAQGGSAGGMLMGAVVNMAPELFAGVIAEVPFVDVLNTMLRADLPLTPPEWLEWGNPIEDATAFARLASYSPYDNVAAQNYPPILALAGLTDPRVTYWEPLKWVQKLRATMTGGGPVLLKTQMGAGHAGASGRFESLEETALEWAFALMCVGWGGEEA
ncbi:S9 family peptidase [Methylocystis bryophila]|uniref:S9 family peptidase n=1 Tax=Methylocystis bryophila TaxID=655015 RepID=A0A1W6MZK2_9HYPH|nr:S9 family peptidase [Methylocystis bryophila]ARN83012.1 S9 family peptidase [Methylocystis bryophila]BDV39312.1 peptidase S9 [Methylocystis bryophila]